MTTIDEEEGTCRHGIWPAQSCSTCSGKDAARAAAGTQVVHWFDARYAGRLGCGCTVEPGDRIGRLADDTFVCDRHGGSRPPTTKGIRNG